MTKKKLTLKQRWAAETPKLAKLSQKVLTGLSAGCGAIWLLWDKIPTEFRETVPSEILSVVTIAGIVSVFLLQFTMKKAENCK